MLDDQEKILKEIRKVLDEDGIEFKEEKQTMRIYGIKHPEWSKEEFYHWCYYSNFRLFESILTGKYNIDHISPNFNHISFNVHEWIEVKRFTIEYYLENGKKQVKLI